MTPSFFQSFEAHQVAYLLISGQATVLYGAADFSEDIDLWIEPTPVNLSRFLSALRHVRANYYKLTPIISTERLLTGHGFHFSIHAEHEFYLDVMGRPPRVGSFSDAFSKREEFEFEWGKLPVIGIHDLAEVKKTQRLRDYGIVGQLALRFLDRLGAAATFDDYIWAARNIFSLADLEELARLHPTALQHSPEISIRNYGMLRNRGKEVPQLLEDQIEKAFLLKMSALQKADREYWKPIIDELRKFNAQGLLERTGNPV